MARRNIWTFMALSTTVYAFFMMLWNVANVTNEPMVFVPLMTFVSYCAYMGNRSGKGKGFLG